MFCPALTGVNQAQHSVGGRSNGRSYAEFRLAWLGIGQRRGARV